MKKTDLLFIISHMTNKLTERQKEVLNAIKFYARDNGGRTPTYAEITEMMGFRSENSAVDHVKALIKKNKIRITPKISRGIEIL